ncbi:hypothetical protein FHY55_17160 [Oceanicola sp. D3]|uniref:EI24 domain-containing protein n=1 Tax=Oceanicola sp. D3 TaxID=2587163 RepID=UPI00111F2A20|nr:EI24 domain-containing protein [Oceanicola sp. D3]QDC10857.1 hypothetical protein FHY55_17160 [Oceanicola sp. D3]
MIFSDFGKAVNQMFDGRFLKVLAMGLGLTLLLLFGVYGVFLMFLDWVTPDSFTIFGREVTWIDDLLSWASIALMALMSIFLMVPVASAFTGLFLEDVAAAVEDRHYPELPDVPRFPWTEALRDSLGFFGILIVVNVLMLILYIFAGPLIPLLFWAINGLLLGREYYQMVAMRRIGRKAANESRRRHFGKIWFAGTLMAIPLSFPLINLFIPILGVATFTHMFHRLEPNLAALTPQPSGPIR